MKLDATDRRLIEATQHGLPIVAAPFAVVAAQVGLSESETIDRLAALKHQGVIRRIGAAPNHFRLGMTANGMTVWDVEDAQVSDLGARIGALPYVTHCYRRPRALPDWPYNLFAMVHGSDRGEVHRKQDEIRRILGDASRAGDVLFSKRILKKTGLRLRSKEG
jgi:DNA-binding Lrp family transcriptional regulator